MASNEELEAMGIKRNDKNYNNNFNIRKPNNLIEALLKITGWISIIISIVLGIILGTTFEVEVELCIEIIIKGIVGGILIVGIGEIIKLLKDIIDRI